MTTKPRYIRPPARETRTIEQIKADTGLIVCPGVDWHGQPLKPSRHGDYPCGKLATRASGLCGIHDNVLVREHDRQQRMAAQRAANELRDRDRAEAMNLAMMLTDAAQLGRLADGTPVSVRFDHNDRGYIQLTRVDARALLKLLQARP